jgi:hypothetical protein
MGVEWDGIEGGTRFGVVRLGGCTGVWGLSSGVGSSVGSGSGEVDISRGKDGSRRGRGVRVGVSSLGAVWILVGFDIGFTGVKGGAGSPCGGVRESVVSIVLSSSVVMGAMGAKRLEVQELCNRLTDTKWVGVSNDWGGLMGAVTYLGS